MPLGSLGIGFMAAAMGAPRAMVVEGMLLIAFFAAMLDGVASLRRLSFWRY